MRIAVAVSGGVDSTVSALLLKAQGHDVFGVSMLTAGSERDEQLFNIYNALDIPLHIIDLSADFSADVLGYAISEHLRARTPNPCVMCNKRLKFGRLMQKAFELGAEKMATGHYAFIEENPSGLFRLKKARDRWKDQSYFLYRLTQSQLSGIVFPLSDMENKDAVREIARNSGVLELVKKESQNICFAVDDDSYSDVVFSDARFSGIGKGRVFDSSGKFLGEHEGYCRYTIGQRKGLNIAAAERLYVVAVKPELNELVLGPREELAVRRMRLSDISLVHDSYLPAGIEVTCCYRYKNPGGKAELAPIESASILPGGKVEVTYAESMFGVAPGQSAVFYDGDEVIGGGFIDSTEVG